MTEEEFQAAVFRRFDSIDHALGNLTQRVSIIEVDLMGLRAEVREIGQRVSALEKVRA